MFTLSHDGMLVSFIQLIIEIQAVVLSSLTNISSFGLVESLDYSIFKYLLARVI